MNLIPLEYRLKVKAKRNKERNIIISLLILLIMVGFSLYNYNNILSYQEKIIVLDKRLDSLKPVIAENRLLEQEKAKLRNKENLIGRLAQQLSYQQILIDLNHLIPEGVVLTGFIINQNQQFQVNARSINNREVIETVKQIEEYPYFAEVSLDYTESTAEKISFRVAGRLDL